jgi:uncharacterized protein YbgA (DUF1722 family)/uncharacterized protein YbbK (DUF523 family)
MSGFVKPIVVVSKCLGFAHCRWNEQIIADDFVHKLRPHVDFRPVCPEVEIGLGVPRDPLRVVSLDGDLRLVQPATGADVTEPMQDFAQSFLDSVPEVDGFILKGRSPSCGMKDVKVYAGLGKGQSISSKGRGFFGGAVVDRFPDLPIEDEGRLRSFRLREHFLTKLFALARFRLVRDSGAMRELVRFHSENKYLLMAYHQGELKELGRIVANADRRPFAQVVADYEAHLLAAFARAPRCTSNINVMMHAMGHFSEGLSAGEKTFFLDSVEKYRDARVPLSVTINLLRSWVVRFGEEYLGRQTFFQPYPEGLLEIADSGKGGRECD